MTEALGVSQIFPATPPQAPVTSEAPEAQSPESATDPPTSAAPKDPTLDVVPSSSSEYPPVDHGEPPRGTVWNEAHFAAAKSDMHAAGFTVRAEREAELRFEGALAPALDAQGLPATLEARRRFLIQFEKELVEYQERHQIPDEKFNRVLANWINRIPALEPRNLRPYFLPQEAKRSAILAEMQALDRKGQKGTPRWNELHAESLALSDSIATARGRRPFSA